MRKASRYTDSLSGHRLMTQLEMTASAKSSGKYDSAKSPTTNSIKSVRPTSATACAARSIIGCAKSTPTTSRSYPVSGENHIYARTAPQIHDHLPRSKIGEAHRITTTSRKLDNEFRDRCQIFRSVMTL